MGISIVTSGTIAPLESIVHDAENESLLPLIPEETRRLLDVGCGSGVLGARIKAARERCEVVGVTISDAEANACVGRLDQVVVRDLTKDGLGDLGRFDCVVCSHALGYFHDLPRILREISGVLEPDGVLVAAIPNVLHWRQRLEFLRGRFRYQESGQLHYYYARFFDYETAASCLVSAGYEILTRDTDGYLPMPGLRRLLGERRARRLDRAVTRRLPGLLSTEFLIAARPTSAGAPEVTYGL